MNGEPISVMPLALPRFGFNYLKSFFRGSLLFLSCAANPFMFCFCSSPDDYAFENYYPRPRTIKPGDSLEVSCIYNKVANLKFGEASSEEMCMDFIA